jgi:hypothetical protein
MQKERMKALTLRLTKLASVVLLGLILCTAGYPQKMQSLKANAKGKGTISSGAGNLNVYSVLIELKENGDAELTLVSDLQLNFEGKWTASESSEKEIDLQISGGVVSGNSKGTGKLFLRNDLKSIDKLNVEAKTISGKITISFVADK